MAAERRVQRILAHLAPGFKTFDPSLSPAVVSGQKFIYTQGGVLTPEQRAFYDENGFIMIKGLLPADRLEMYRERFCKIANGEVERVPSMLMMRDVGIAKKKQMGEKFITKLQDFQDDEILFQYCSEPEIIKYVSSVIGPNVRSVHSMLINKPPDVGIGSSRHPPHQDLWYFPFRPAEKIVASWTAMQLIDKKNGCLYVLPGTHKHKLLKHEYPNDGVVNRAYHGIQGMTEQSLKGAVHLRMEPGDTVFFHPILIHGSGMNLSDGYRKAISCHYAATNCHFIEVTGTMQEDIAREVEEMTKMKGLEVPFADVWRLKSRLVAGKDQTFV
eukprot:TRINITY_DN5171_c0_g1_i1.p1 TRINITY_DN5171_c0_g1~~TRINITY_DN5171_c0_g1_i1.p1  ORF type:complete len:349 (-),score=99.10 TRINITY_DN5171_c0_g1_i1:182-1165(-)